ncbi:MAG TPA: DUF4424 domain-containing protein [Allosphingosinicella sp.]|nr:DUF4424 domain-containing protein [Allosphingosinicella sp.]
MPRAASLALSAVLCLVATASLANDSTAEKAAGGLVLTRTDAIDMVSEDLYVSPEQVRVAYVFRNRTRAPIRTIVAFPMPDRDLDEMYNSDTNYPGDFRTLVDGRPVTMQVERRAMLNGVDHTAMLTGLGIPVQTSDPASDVLIEAIRRLRPADRQRLAEMGLIGNDAGLHPMWTVKETYYWEQVFPAGRDLRVQHSYSPGTGGSVTVALASPDFRNSPEGRAEQRRHCTDRAFLAALDRMSAREGNGIVLTQQNLSYILTTGGNWRSPIGRFRLVVDKLNPRALISFCGEGVRWISPTQFEIRRRNWRPTRDLHILIATPNDTNQ